MNTSKALCGEQLKTSAFSSDLSRVLNNLIFLNSDQKTPGLDRYLYDILKPVGSSWEESEKKAQSV